MKSISSQIRKQRKEVKEVYRVASKRTMTEAKALRIIRRYYAGDPEGYASDLAITKKRGESLIDWAQQILDGV